MEDNKFELKVGDKLYRTSRGIVTGHLTINKVTKTMAMCGAYRFKKEQFKKGTITSIGSGKWNSVYYEMASVGLDNKFRRQKLIIALKEVVWQNYSLEKLEDIYKYLNKKANEQ